MSVLTRKWDSVAKLFLLHVKFPPMVIMALVFVVTFPVSVQGRNKPVNSVGLCSCVALCLSYKKFFLPPTEAGCAAESVETCFQPEGPPHQLTAAPSVAANVNNAAFPQGSCQIPRDSTQIL